MKRFGIACCVLVLAATTAGAQPLKVVAHDKRFGCGKITTLEKLAPVKDPGAPKVGDAGDDRPTVTLKSTDWTSGCCFTDEQARRWCMMEGAPLVDKPAVMKGWIMQGESGDIYFLHESGSLYRRCPTKVATVDPNPLLFNPFGD